MNEPAPTSQSELSVVGVRVELPSQQPIVLLKEIDGERYLPIWIGAVEATAIAFAQQGVVTARPMTHDLLRDLLTALDRPLKSVTITALRDGVFYAELGFDGGLSISARPSDAIALAMRTGAVIRSEEAVLVEAGITYRQLDYWARTGLVESSVREASGSGTQRLYSFRDILVLKIVKKLLDAGISLQNIRTAISTLRDRGIEDLGEITLMSDGTTVYECVSTDEVVDLLQGGQAVFGIAVGRHLREVEGTLALLPGERAVRAEPGEVQGPAPTDELSSRRSSRLTA